MKLIELLEKRIDELEPILANLENLQAIGKDAISRKTAAIRLCEDTLHLNIRLHDSMG